MKNSTHKNSSFFSFARLDFRSGVVPFNYSTEGSNLRLLGICETNVQHHSSISVLACIKTLFV